MAGLIYLIVVVRISLQGRLVPALLISIVALCCFDYFFTPPLFELRLADPLDVVALAAFVTTASVVTTLISRVRKSFQEQALRVQLRLIIDTIPGVIWSALLDGSVDFTPITAGKSIRVFLRTTPGAGAGRPQCTPKTSESGSA